MASTARATEHAGIRRERAVNGGAAHCAHSAQHTMPRALSLGFAGAGWIGRNRMEAVLSAGCADAAAVCDTCPDALAAAAVHAPGARHVDRFEALLELPLDGIVIATPSALHAEQAIAALERGMAVFCQKPLARTANEARRVVEAARQADRLLGVDLSYRYTAAYRAVGELIRAGELGEVYAVDLTFHNAYGPDKAWFRDPALAGGGCLLDLGVHLVDLALLSLNWPAVDSTTSHLFARGRPLEPGRVEDHATATLCTCDGRTARLACSWDLHAGSDAVIEMKFHGTEGGATIRNVNGSFYDFVAEQFRGTSRRVLAEPPDAWGGRAAVAWARRLALTPRFDAEAERFITVSEIIDRIYRR